MSWDEPTEVLRVRQVVKVVHPNPGTAVDGARHLPPPWGVWVSDQHRSPACRHEPTNDPLLLLVLLGISGWGLLTPQPVCVLLLGFFGGGFGPRVSVARIWLCCCWDLVGVSVKGEPALMLA